MSRPEKEIANNLDAVRKVSHWSNFIQFLPHKVNTLVLAFMKDLCHFESINLPTYILLTFAQHCAALGTDRWHKGQRPRCKLLTQLSMNRNLGRYYVHTYLLFLIVSLCFRIFFFVCFTAVFNISFIVR